jgi:hypothetical protein
MSKEERHILTCVYCGHAYPEGTPPHGSKVLTDHIKICEKHPLREAESKIAKLREALLLLVGSSDENELSEMVKHLRQLGIPQEKLLKLENAINILLETA